MTPMPHNRFTKASFIKEKKIQWLLQQNEALKRKNQEVIDGDVAKDEIIERLKSQIVLTDTVGKEFKEAQVRNIQTIEGLQIDLYGPKADDETIINKEKEEENTVGRMGTEEENKVVGIIHTIRK